MRTLNKKQRLWVRPNNAWGPQTSIHRQVQVEITPHFEDKGRKCASINADWGIRDCSEYVSLDMFCSEERHAKAQIKALTKVRDSLNATIEDMEEAVRQCKESGAW